MSAFGGWAELGGLPVFRYGADPRLDPTTEWDPITVPPTRRHFVAIGNRRLQAVVDNEGAVCVWDEADGLRWLVAPEPGGSGVTHVEEPGAPAWGSSLELWPDGAAPERTFGPTWFTVTLEHTGLGLERTVMCPEGETPWLLVRVRISNRSHRSRELRLEERWALRARFVNLLTSSPAAGFEIERTERGLLARERRSGTPAPLGAPIVLGLDALDDRSVGAAADDGEGGPTVLRLRCEETLLPGASVERWFRFGCPDPERPDPARMFAASLDRLRRRLPRAAAPRSTASDAAAGELRWHAALLSGGACRDHVLGGHTLDQGSAYSFVLGFNGAARDPLQHALPLVYTEPDLALSVLRNTCRWASPSGELPYGLDGAKQPWTSMWQPSDSNLWALWLAAEYASATGDLDAFTAPLGFHPATGGADRHGAEVSLAEHLGRQFRFLVDGVGRGEHGLIRMRNADWNDMATRMPGIDRELMVARGESVLNSAMAAWVLPVWAALAERLGRGGEAAEARRLADELRAAVAAEWTGRWFRRAHAPGVVVGEDDLWLEVQPWAILCGAAGEDRGRALLGEIDRRLRHGSPLGARVREPIAGAGRGEGTGGGIWASINMTLVWAAARLEPELAWDEWGRMSLAAHTAAYPAIWEGTLSGPDAWNSPEAERPGRTWASAELGVAMQQFPVNNLHSHAQPLLAFLRLLGVEPTSAGTLAVGAGGAFASPTFELRPDGGGRLHARGRVVVEPAGGGAGRPVAGGPGEVAW